MRPTRAIAVAVLVGLAAGVTVLGSASAGVGEVTKVTESSAKDAKDAKKVKVECVPADGGDLRTGGGAQIVSGGNDVAVIATKPTGTHGWMAKAVEINPTSEPWRLKVFAVCADS